MSNIDIEQDKVICIVPTLNAGDNWNVWLDNFEKQCYRPRKLVVIDSLSDDETVALAKKRGFDVISIERKDFNHGGTRQMGTDMFPEAKVVIFLTQDAILADEFAIDNILKCFKNEDVGAAYGRQLPHLDSGVISRHARLFNYSETSQLKSFSDAKKLGIKTAFISNSFAAYKMEALMVVGGFPKHTILSEDTYVAAKMILAGYKIQYCAEAKVYHSHDYNVVQEFKRYFDIGVFHARESWIQEKLGKAEGEGLKFVLSEVVYLLKHGKGYLLPAASIRTCLKYVGYRLGINEDKIPVKIKKKLSMHWRYWN